MIKGKRILNIGFYVLGVCYVFIMLDLFFRFNIISSGGNASRSYNLIPFHTIMGYAGGDISVSRTLVASNILGNIAVFIPFGLYLQVLLKNKAFIKSLFIVVITTVSIELIQFVFILGSADIDDVLLNALGGVIGILFYKLLLKLSGNGERVKTAVTVISLVVGLPVIAYYLMICVRRYF